MDPKSRITKLINTSPIGDVPGVTGQVGSEQNMGNESKNQERKNKGGQPAKPKVEPGNPQAAALANLQWALDRACRYVHDGAGSYARRVRYAAANGVPQGTVMAGLDAMEAALRDARAFAVRVYSAPETKKTTPASRFTLTVDVAQENA